MKFGVVVFPGTSSQPKIIQLIQNIFHKEAFPIWHKDTTLSRINQGDCIIIPGGTAHGDYLRPGAFASTSPIMQAVKEFAQHNGFLLGIGNGFQILCEAGLLPGALIINQQQRFLSTNVYLRTITNHSALTANILHKEIPLKLPLACKYGRYFAPESLLQELEANDQILFKYSDELGEIHENCNPTGAYNNIAGICSQSRTTFGIMPHPERATESILGNEDGKIIFESLIHAATNLVDN